MNNTGPMTRQEFIALQAQVRADIRRKLEERKKETPAQRAARLAKEELAADQQKLLVHQLDLDHWLNAAQAWAEFKADWDGKYTPEAHAEHLRYGEACVRADHAGIDRSAPA